MALPNQKLRNARSIEQCVGKRFPFILYIHACECTCTYKAVVTVSVLFSVVNMVMSEGLLSSCCCFLRPRRRSGKSKNSPFHVKILLLDRQELIQEVKSKTTGQDLLDSIFKYLNLAETAYFGLRYQDNASQTVSVGTH